jgi:hypothetical protein
VGTFEGEGFSSGMAANFSFAGDVRGNISDCSAYADVATLNLSECAPIRFTI